MTSLVLKIILQALAVSIALLVSVLDYVFHDKNSQRFKVGVRCLIALSIVFLVASIFVTYIDARENDKKESLLKDQLGDVQLQNKHLQKTISVLSQDQKSSFDSLYAEQKKVSDETALQINRSADRLHEGINDSINLLKRSSKQIDRTAYPIKELRVSCQLEIPIETDTGEAYKNRILKAISELKDVPNGLREMGEFYDRSGNLDQRIAINKEPHLPDKTNEPALFWTMQSVFISITMYKEAVPISELIKAQPTPDLHMYLAGSVDKAMPKRQSSYDFSVTSISLFYELNRMGFVVAATELVPSYLRNNSGKIISIPDLSGSQMVIRVGDGFVYGAKNNQHINSEIQTINKSTRIRSIQLRMSDGMEIKIKGSELSLHKDNKNNVFFVYYFPKTVLRGEATVSSPK